MAFTRLSPTKPSNLKGLSTLITGGVSGLGLSSVIFLPESRALVTITDIQDGSKIATDLVDRGYKVQFIKCDAKDWGSQVQVFQAALNFSPRH